MIEIKNVEVVGRFGEVRVTYNILHSTPGADGTTLTNSLKMAVSKSGARCDLVIDDCAAPTPEEALDKMASWCERMATALRQRGDTRSIPLN